MIAQLKTEVAFATHCSDLVKIVSTPREWPAFGIHLDELMKLKEKFSFFSLCFISRTLNSKVEGLQIVSV